MRKIILASIGASPQVNDFLQKLVTGINIIEEQKKVGSVRIEEVEEAQLELIIHMNYSFTK